MSFYGILGATFGLSRLMAMLGPALPIVRSSFRKASSNRRWKRNTGTNPPNRTGWWRRNADLSPLVITERMLMRHGWYRRKLRKEGIPIGTKNSMVLR